MIREILGKARGVEYHVCSSKELKGRNFCGKWAVNAARLIGIRLVGGVLGQRKILQVGLFVQSGRSFCVLVWSIGDETKFKNGKVGRWTK